MTNETMYAAIGTDGMREVVWGIGETEEAAEAEAASEAREAGCDPELRRTVAVTAEQAARIEAGEVDAATLGL